MEHEKKCQRQEILSDLYSKRQNLIIHGIPATDLNEDKTQSLQKVKFFLKNQLKIDREILIVDAHRLKSMKMNDTKRNTRSTTKDNPIIIRLSNLFDKDLIIKSLKELKPNDGSKQKIFVNQHLPSAMFKQKSILLNKFKDARKEKKRTRWAVDYKLPIIVYI